MSDYLSRQIEMLKKVRSALAHVTESRERVHERITDLDQLMPRLESQAVKARTIGREDLAHVALTRLTAAQTERAELAAQHDRLLGEEAKMTTAAQRLQARIGTIPG